MVLPTAQPCWTRALFAAMAATCCIGCNDATRKKPIPLPSPREDVIKHFDAGKRLVEEGDGREAVVEFTSALRYTLRYALRYAHNKVACDDADALQADIYYQRGLAFFKMNFPDTAKEDFTAVIRLRPEDSVAYGQRGQTHFELGNLYGAVRDCTDAIRWDPNNASAYRYRGLAYLQLRRCDRAVADLEQAIRLDQSLDEAVRPQLAKAYLRWSDRLAAAGQDAEAAQKLAQARELNPDIVSETPSEPKEYETAKPVVPDAGDAVNRGRELLAKRQYDEALNEFTAAIVADQNCYDAYLWRGETWLATGFLDSALRDADKAIQINGGSADAYRLQARAHAKQGDPYRVVLAATEAIYLDPTSAESYKIRGSAYVERGEWEPAIADLEEALRRDAALKDEVEPILAKAYRLRDAARVPHDEAPGDGGATGLTPAPPSKPK